MYNKIKDDPLYDDESTWLNQQTLRLSHLMRIMVHPEERKKPFCTHRKMTPKKLLFQPGIDSSLILGDLYFHAYRTEMESFQDVFPYSDAFGQDRFD